MLKIYKVIWKTIRYGESTVKALNKEEARKLSNLGADEDDFIESDDLGAWVILEITKMKD